VSLKVILFLLVYVSGLGLSSMYPVFGVLTYLWTFYEYPEMRWWGTGLTDVRWSLTAGIITLISVAIHRGGGPDANPMSESQDNATSVRPKLSSTGFYCLAAYAVWMWIQTPWAADPDAHYIGCMLFTKYVALWALLQFALSDVAKIRWFLLANAIGAGVWGVMMWQSDIGAARMEIPLGPGVEDSNTIGLHLATCAAFAGALIIGWRSRLRWTAAAGVPFILNGVVLAGSRGGVLGLAGASAAVLLFGPRQRKIVLVGAAIAGLALFARLSRSETFTSRMATVRVSGEEPIEGSAASRFYIAQANWALFLDHPLGVGHRGDIPLSPQYMPDFVLDSEAGIRAAHATIFAVLTNQGVPGIILFVAMHLWAAYVLVRIWFLDKQGLPPELGAFRAAIAAGLVAYVICGMFSNYIKAEIGIWCFALVPILQREVSRWENEHSEMSVTELEGTV
jgi:O-Antigen ligase